MKQHEAVIQTLEKMGGQATLGQLYQEVMKIKDCEWKTKTPFASIRRIVQVRPEIFKVRPGLWALRLYKHKLGLVEYKPTNEDNKEVFEKGHSYFQGILAEIGNFRGYKTFIPSQDKNKKYVNKPLGSTQTLNSIPLFGYKTFIDRISTIDVSWFNNRNMPSKLFEVEHSTNFINSLWKFYDLQDYFLSMVIVSSEHRRREFFEKISHASLLEIKSRVKFINYDTVIEDYELEFSKTRLRDNF
jgi:hypothetical protein